MNKCRENDKFKEKRKEERRKINKEQKGGRIKV